MRYLWWFLVWLFLQYPFMMSVEGGLPERDHREAHPLKVLHHLHRSPAVESDLPDVEPLWLFLQYPFMMSVEGGGRMDEKDFLELLTHSGLPGQAP